MNSADHGNGPRTPLGSTAGRFESGESERAVFGEEGMPLPTPGYWPRIEEAFLHNAFNGAWMDALWSQGWRHFGPQFFRYSLAVHEERVVRVLPLRMDLHRWTPSKSQRRTLRRNQDLQVQVVRPALDEEHRLLFQRHCQRFHSNVPDQLENFLGPDPGRHSGAHGYPCECVEVSVRHQGRLVACSYLDMGAEAVSSVYACFEPSEAHRSLGVATFLWEADYARHRGCRHLYPGYAYDAASPYDYKKRLGALEVFDWRQWHRWDQPPP